MQKKNFNLFENLEKSGINVNDEQKRKIINHINEILSYQPKVGVLGKTGAGKSSLCNALFGLDVAPISDVSACTRDIQKVFVDLGANKSIILVDVPGVGENKLRDEEYGELYKSILPELDIVLWLLKADDRALSIDEIFFKTIVKPYLSQGKPFLIVLNQVDKIEPCIEWDREKHKPSIRQFDNILLKISEISTFFDFSASKILPVSVNEGYNLMLLVDEMVDSLPNDKKIVLLTEICEENVSQKAKNNAFKCFLESIDLWCLEHISSYLKAKAFVQSIIAILFETK